MENFGLNVCVKFFPGLKKQSIMYRNVSGIHYNFNKMDLYQPGIKTAVVSDIHENGDHFFTNNTEIIEIINEKEKEDNFIETRKDDYDILETPLNIPAEYGSQKVNIICPYGLEGSEINYFLIKYLEEGHGDNIDNYKDRIPSEIYDELEKIPSYYVTSIRDLRICNSINYYGMKIQLNFPYYPNSRRNIILRNVFRVLVADHLNKKSIYFLSLSKIESYFNRIFEEEIEDMIITSEAKIEETSLESPNSINEGRIEYGVFKGKCISFMGSKCLIVGVTAGNLMLECKNNPGGFYRAGEYCPTDISKYDMKENYYYLKVPSNSSEILRWDTI